MDGERVSLLRQARWGGAVAGAITAAIVAALVMGPAPLLKAPVPAGAVPGIASAARKVLSPAHDVSTPAGEPAQRFAPAFASDRGASATGKPEKKVKKPKAAVRAIEQVAPMYRCMVECGAKEELPAAQTQVTLTRTAGGVFVTGWYAGLEPGNVYTVWFVVFNRPEYCVTDADGPYHCGGLDAFSPRAQTTHLMGGHGLVGRSGTGAFFGGVAADGAHGVFPWEPVLYNPLDSEIFVILRDHGPEQSDATDQSTTMNGGCIQAVMPGSGSIGKNMCENKLVAPFTAPSRRL